MRKLFLASYFTEVACMLPDFAGGDCAGRRVAFIPTAALHEEAAVDIDTDRAALQNLGCIVEDLEISSAPYERIKKCLLDTDYIFVGGGNTFFLLQELKRTGADELIVEHISKGKLYISTSAGSCVLSKEVIADGIDSPDAAPDLKGDHSALSVIDYYIFPHYGEFSPQESDEQIISEYYDRLDVKRINDKQAVTVEGEKIETITVKE